MSRNPRPYGKFELHNTKEPSLNTGMNRLFV